MKRITFRSIKEIVPRQEKKNKSCKLDVQEVKTQSSRLFYTQQTSSVEVVWQVINNIFEMMDIKLEKVEEKSQAGQLERKVQFLERSIIKMLEPVAVGINPQTSVLNLYEEFKGQQSEFQIKFIQNEKKSHKSSNPSKTAQSPFFQSALSRNETLTTIHQKKSQKNIKSLNQGQLKRTLQLLKDCQEEQKDPFETMLRHKKISKESTIMKKAYLRNSLQQDSSVIIKKNNTKICWDFSYDYDGSIFPLNRNTKTIINGPKILNTKCKVNKKQQFEPKKVHKLSKMSSLLTKLETNQQFLNNNNAEISAFVVYEQRLKMPRIMQADTIFNNEQGQLNNSSHEMDIDNRIQKSIISKDVKIREIAV